ncbi:MAG TPA: adenylate/guanylate cyclase domain-containing protein [Dehalococcoidia bacterium]|nr:adenylate/guanylate cyclase domain-containing protein [Dehalococcoidia bacterium]
MAFFGAPFQPEDHTTRTVQSALEIVSGTQPCPENIDGLPAGGGIATGGVFMGNVGEGEVRDFTVIGDTVNTAARLQSLAGPGEVFISNETFRAVLADVNKTESRTLELKGKEEPVLAHEIKVAGNPLLSVSKSKFLSLR